MDGTLGRGGKKQKETQWPKGHPVTEPVTISPKIFRLTPLLLGGDQVTSFNQWDVHGGKASNFQSLLLKTVGMILQSFLAHLKQF